MVRGVCKASPCVVRVVHARSAAKERAVCWVSLEQNVEGEYMRVLSKSRYRFSTRE